MKGFQKIFILFKTNNIQLKLLNQILILNNKLVQSV